MWNPFRKRRDGREIDAIPGERPAIEEDVNQGGGDVTIFNAVVREPATGLHGLKTASGKPLRPTIEYKESAF